tara:strand:- start:25181 stop:25390 length:210 start_codon:yes stop_codon:yes gene_type:complete
MERSGERAQKRRRWRGRNRRMLAVDPARNSGRQPIPLADLVRAHWAHRPALEPLAADAGMVPWAQVSAF